LRALVLLLLAALLWAAEVQPSPLSLSVSYSNLTLGHEGRITITLCNPSRLPVHFASASFASDGALISPSQVSAGFLAPGKCWSYELSAVPLKREALVEYTLSGTVSIGNNRATSYSQGSFVLISKAPELVVMPVEASSAGGRVEVEVRNAGDAPFNGTLLFLKPVPARLELSVPPGGRAVGELRLPPMNPGQYEVQYRAKYGLALLEGRAKLFVRPSPEVRLELGRSIKICFPRKELAVLTLVAEGAVPSPSQTVLTVEGCKTVSYSLLSPQLPVRVAAKAKIGMLELNATSAASQCAVELNGTSLWAGYDNPLRLSVSCPLPLVGNVSLVPSVGSVSPAVLPAEGGHFVWSLPPSAEGAVLEVVLFGRAQKFAFNVVPFQPSLSVNVKPAAVMEGSVFPITVCLTNTWVKALKNVQVTAKASNWTASATFREIPPKGQACLSGRASAPWNSTSIKVFITTIISSYTKEFVKEITVVTSPYTASPAVVADAKSLPVGKAEVVLKVKNLGKGFAKGATLALFSENLLYPSEVYLGDLPPGGEKEVKVTFFVPKDVREVRLRAELSFCSGPAAGTCTPKAYAKSFTFPVSQYVPPQLSFTVQEARLAGGEEGAVRVKVVNTGNDVAKNIVVIASSEELELKESYFTINEIPPGSAFRLEIPVRAPEVLEPADAKLRLKARFSDSWGGAHEAEAEFGIKVEPKPSPVLGLNLLTPTLPVGDVKLRFTLTNSGNADAKNVKVVLYASGISLKEGEFSFPVLGPGQTVEIEAPATAVAPGTYSLTAVVKYNKTETFSYKIKVVQGPDVVLQDLKLYPQKLYPGGSAVLSFTLFNAGDSEAARLTVVVAGRGVKVSGGKVVVPALDAGRTLPMAFTVSAPPNLEPGTYELVIKVSYSFQGQKIEKTFSATVPVYPRVQAAELPFAERLRPEYLIAPAALLALIAWRLRKRRKRALVIEE